jgi:hypothetical protein
VPLSPDARSAADVFRAISPDQYNRAEQKIDSDAFYSTAVSVNDGVLATPRETCGPFPGFGVCAISKATIDAEPNLRLKADPLPTNNAHCVIVAAIPSDDPAKPRRISKGAAKRLRNAAEIVILPAVSAS